MIEQFLNRPDIISVLQEGGREGVLGEMIDGSHEQRNALEGQASRDARALRAARPSRLWRAIPGRSHRATSVGRAGRGNRSESTPARFGLSRADTLWADALCGGRRVRDLSREVPVWVLAPAWGRRRHRTRGPGMACLVRVRIVSEYGWMEGCRWDRRTLAQLAVRGSGTHDVRMVLAGRGRRLATMICGSREDHRTIPWGAALSWSDRRPGPLPRRYRP
jgi:hypothetical protein